ncbi:hypothetical protein CDG76_26875 [Nostoc sp. 'Peltigera membranacea cyanobiont' 210A]|uniref:hypothetical protein n=1 Tax=Nostoc sp. 'Peltigera membranacea cyanobiont' 210A TaxID=2014529 RepID=UPI000B955F7D|nr:hypothetical protein [Nostoc sp. 'Peltigera membranacea cyanobiont' 210A]OYD91517.1 hypothetical protein CDG76_26875 [Nostoc sp. 'Peltigera membranacea cyanobiont' 210A]
MNLFLQERPASKRTLKTIQETPAPVQDPLIARGLQKEQYAGIIGLAIALIAAVGFFSRRVEYAIAFAVFLSAILIALFLFI